jgi:hypothetical protein
MKVSFEPGPAGTGLAECVYIASDGSKDNAGQPRMVVVRATHILNPAFVGAVEQIRASAATKEEKDAQLAALPVQPEHIAEQLEKTCSSLEEVHSVCLELARRNASSLEVQAQTGNTGGTSPTWSTEPHEKIKVDPKSPKYAAEAGPTTGEMPTQGGSKVKSFFGRLPGQTVGEPQRAVDIHSSQLDPIVAQELTRLRAENEQLKDEKGARAKDDEHKEVMGILTELGALEDAKDREGFSKDLSALDEKGLGVLEKILRKVRDAKAGKPAGGPKGPGGMPPKPPAPAGGPKSPMGGPPKPPAGLPAMSSLGNLAGMPDLTRSGVPLTASAMANMDPALLLQQIMFSEDQKKVIGRTR